MALKKVSNCFVPIGWTGFGWKLCYSFYCPTATLLSDKTYPFKIDPIFHKERIDNIIASFLKNKNIKVTHPGAVAEWKHEKVFNIPQIFLRWYLYSKYSSALDLIFLSWAPLNISRASPYLSATSHHLPGKTLTLLLRSLWEKTTSSSRSAENLLKIFYHRHWSVWVGLHFHLHGVRLNRLLTTNIWSLVL